MVMRLSNAPPKTEANSIVLELVNHIDAMVAVWDINQVCVFANDAYLSWFGISGKEMVGLTMDELLGPLYSLNLPHILAASAGQPQAFEREIHSPDGRIRHSLATYTPQIVDGLVAGIFEHVADVTSLKNLEQKLMRLNAESEKLATHDFLTGLPNRVRLQDRIQQGLALAQHRQQQVAMLTVDLDDFKKVNDTYGHNTGDKVLQEVALRLSHSLRATDSVTRMGGDEFLVLVQITYSSCEVELLVKRIIESVNSPIEIEGETVTPSCSIGVALVYPYETTAESLISMSDKALYAAKKMGKNCFAFY